LPQELVDSCATAQHVEDARRALTDSHIANQRRLVELWTARADLLRAAHPAIGAQLADTEGRLKTVRDRVAKAMYKAGICPESDPQFDANPAAVEHRFNVQRDQNPEIRALIGRCDELMSSYRLAPPESARAQQMADAARRRLLTTYSNLTR
jgi:hypothetical protein